MTTPASDRTTSSRPSGDVPARSADALAQSVRDLEAAFEDYRRNHKALLALRESSGEDAR